MGVESYCVKFYLVRDLWRAWRWRGKEIGTRCLDHGGVRAWLYLGCGCEAGVRVCLSVGKLAVFSGLLLAPDRGKQVLKQRAIVPHHLSSSQITPPPRPAPDCKGHSKVFKGILASPWHIKMGPISF